MTRMSFVSALLAFLALWPSNVSAQGCYNQRRIFSGPIHHTPFYSTPAYQTVYEAPVVHRQIVVEREVVPILLPATVFQYLPAIQAVQAAPVAQLQTQAQLQGAQQVQLQGAQQVQQQGQVPIMQQSQAGPTGQDIDKLVRERVDAVLRERYGLKGDDGPPLLALPPEFQLPPPGQTNVPPGQGSMPPSTGDMNQQVAQLLSTRCASCHTNGEKVSGDVTLFTKQGGQMFFQPSVPKDLILKSVSPERPGMSPRMPRALQGQLPAYFQQQELALLQQWVAQR